VTVACTTEVPATVTEGSVRQFTGGADVWKRPQVFVLVVDDGPAAESASLRAELAARLRKGALEDAMNAGPAWDADWMPAESTLLLVEPTAPPKFHSIPYRTAGRRTRPRRPGVNGSRSPWRASSDEPAAIPS